MSTLAPEVVWRRILAILALVVLADCAMVAAHVIDDPIARVDLGSDLTLPYGWLGGWGLVLLLTGAASFARTTVGGVCRALFSITAGLLLVYMLLQSLGDLALCQVYGQPEGCVPAAQVHADVLQFPFHVGVCVLLAYAIAIISQVSRTLDQLRPQAPTYLPSETTFLAEGFPVRQVQRGFYELPTAPVKRRPSQEVPPPGVDD
jgi:hypothetical protein